LADSILAEVAAGEPSAMQRCIDRYGGLIWSLARRLSADATDAEDAVQEVFLSLWQSAHRFRPEVASESTFITMIARRRLIDRRRRLGKIRQHEILEPELPEPAAEPQELGQSQDAALAEEVLGTLREEQQKVLRMAIFKGLSHRDISDATGLPLGTVKTHARRGLMKVRDVLRARRAAAREARS
jgi:RNA polymerase sigma-70 factor (ECF subfamily)